MKIKLVDYNRPVKYDIDRDVTIGGIYEVLDDSYEYNGCTYYEIIDDVGTRHKVFQKDCVIINEEPIEQASTFDTKDNTKNLTINDIIYFTEFHKDLEISFESGKIHVRDWAGAGDPVEYVVEDAEQLEELVDTLESLNKFKV